MEAELLRGMIADRDLRMEKIQRKSEEQTQRNVELCQQFEAVTEEAHKQSQKIQAETNAFVLQYKGVRGKLEQMQRDFKQQGASLKTYSKDSSASNKMGANGGDASYVMRMQAQLCKAMHSLGITDHQMELATKHTDLIVKYQKETLSICREERTSTELQLMNLLIEKDNERRTIEESYQAKLDVIAKERDALERQMEESGHNLEDDDENNDDDDANEEEDPEEKETKQELMQLLSEKRAEIEQLETLTEDQEDMIVDLEEQVAEIGSPGGVSSSDKITQRKSQVLNSISEVAPPLAGTTTMMNDNNSSDENEDTQKQQPQESSLVEVDDDVEEEEMQEEELPTTSTEEPSDVVAEENNVDGNAIEPTVPTVIDSVETISPIEQPHDVVIGENIVKNNNSDENEDTQKQQPQESTLAVDDDNALQEEEELPATTSVAATEEPSDIVAEENNVDDNEIEPTVGTVDDSVETVVPNVVDDGAVPIVGKVDDAVERDAEGEEDDDDDDPIQQQQPEHHQQDTTTNTEEIQ